MLNRIKDILQLPEACLVNKKITKAFFKRNFDLTTSERTLIDNFSAIATIDWIASISHITANVPTWVDSEATFEEIQVIAVTTTSDGFDRNVVKIIDLVQKYIPYHTLLIVTTGEQHVWNATYKRIHQNDSNKRTIENKYITCTLNSAMPTPVEEAFLEAMVFSKMDTTNLKTLYDGYVQRVVATNTAVVTGTFTPRPIARTQQNVAYLNDIGNLEKDIVTLNNLAKKEKQMNKRIELNNQVQQKRKQIEQLKKLISA